LNSLSNDLLFLFFAMDHSWRILAPFGVSTKAGDDQSSVRVYVHRLGNLVLLPPGLNSKLGAKAPLAKKAEYVATGLAIAADAADRIPTWNRDAVEQREKELLEWAQNEWAD
jgi:hypothetical protein